MPVVVITPEALREKEGSAVGLLREAGFDVRYPRDRHFARGLGGEAAVVEELRAADAVMASSEPYTPRVLAHLPRLRVIARCGVGYDRVDVEAVTAANVVLTITPNSNHEAVAELAMALMLAVAKSLVRNDARVRQGQWPRELLVPLRGKTLGLVGLGRIGRSTAVRARAFGMRIVATETQADPAFLARHQIELVGFDELLERSDFVSLHCPLNDETRGLFDQRAFARMKRGSTLINTARGGLVVEEALVDALRSGRLLGAGLDVLAVEPPPADSPLLAMDNVVLSPHLAGTDQLSLDAMSLEAARSIVELHRGQWPRGAVINEQLREGWRW